MKEAIIKKLTQQKGTNKKDDRLKDVKSNEPIRNSLWTPEYSQLNEKIIKPHYLDTETTRTPKNFVEKRQLEKKNLGKAVEKSITLTNNMGEVQDNFNDLQKDKKPKAQSNRFREDPLMPYKQQMKMAKTPQLGQSP